MGPKRFLLAWAVGMVIGVVLLGGLAVAVGRGGDGDLTAASPDLTSGGLLTVLLDEAQVDGFTERWRGEPPLEDGWSGRSGECDEALVEQADIPVRDDDMRQVAVFDRESDGAELRHELSRVPAEGATLDDTLVAYESCAGPQETDGPHGAAWTAEVTAEAVDGLGEGAILVRSRYTPDDGEGVWEWVEIISARGGVVSSLQMAAGVDRSGESVTFGEVDEPWVLSVAAEIDARVETGIG